MTGNLASGMNHWKSLIVLIGQIIELRIPHLQIRAFIDINYNPAHGLVKYTKEEFLRYWLSKQKRTRTKFKALFHILNNSQTIKKLKANTNSYISAWYHYLTPFASLTYSKISMRFFSYLCTLVSASIFCMKLTEYLFIKTIKPNQNGKRQDQKNGLYLRG